MNFNEDVVDLHLHTNHSDGHFSPRELIDKIELHGIQAVSIVDHDEVSAFPEAYEYGKSKNIEVIPGVELSVNFKNQDIHILGYCFDYQNAQLQTYLSLFRNERLKRADKIVNKLVSMGMTLDFEELVTCAGKGTVGRPHIAKLLVQHGYVFSFQEAFDKYLGDGKPANIEKYNLDINSAVSLIKKAGGVCSIAHPAIQIKDYDLIVLIKSGIQGIEVMHPKHNSNKQKLYKNFAEEYSLIQTGGSDFHGSEKGDDSLGKCNVPYKVIGELKKCSEFYK